jgi:UDP-N-acetylmuramyl pentapeptide phosphotransferase/UDP-N-acetylglucosamine-1-phosphate transferase
LTALGLAAAAASFAVSLAATRLVLGHLRRRAILDIPNERSSHTVPTPRGGGWGILAAVVPALALLPGAGAAPGWALALGAGALAAVSWADDRRGLGPGVRLAAQAAAASGVLALMPADALALQGLLPVWADRLGVLLAWLWFINLYNFMDGIDGIAGAEAAAVGAGVAVVAAATAGAAWAGAPALAVAGAAAGFLVWNWHPAKVFMGDVGSVPLGFVLGWLLLELAVAGAVAAALLLPMFFVADATITLFRRAARGERFWQAHREHAYQRAVRRGLRHDQVVVRVCLLNAVLIALAAASAAVGPAADVVLVASGLACTVFTLRLLAVGPAEGER